MSILSKIPQGSLLIIVGSQQGGLLFTLREIRRAYHRDVLPVRTHTNRPTRREDTDWFSFVTNGSWFHESEVLTSYSEVTSYTSNIAYGYLVTYESVVEIVKYGGIAVVGMNAMGYAALCASLSETRCPFCKHRFEDPYGYRAGISRSIVVALKPEEETFSRSLELMWRMTEEYAIEYTERVKNESTLPPLSSERISGVYTVPISGPKDVDVLEKLALTLEAS